MSGFNQSYCCWSRANNVRYIEIDAEQTLRGNTVFYKCNNDANRARGHPSVEGGWNAINIRMKVYHLRTFLTINNNSVLNELIRDWAVCRPRITKYARSWPTEYVQGFLPLVCRLEADFEIQKKMRILVCFWDCFHTKFRFWVPKWLYFKYLRGHPLV